MQWVHACYLHQYKGLLGESGMGVRGEQGPLCPAHPLPEVRILKLILDTSTDKAESPDSLSLLFGLSVSIAEHSCCLPAAAAAAAAAAVDWFLRGSVGVREGCEGGWEMLKALGCSCVVTLLLDLPGRTESKESREGCGAWLSYHC